MNFLYEITNENYSGDLFDQGFNFGEVALFGGKIVLIGMLAVFSVLTIIWGALTLFKLVFHDLHVKAPKKEVVVEAAPIAPVEAPVYQTNDDEIVAVIAAAIAAAESESYGSKFRVVSFRRK